MAKFETLKSEEIKYGTNNFIEIALKKVIPEEGESGEENTFISISKGWYPQNVEEPGLKRWKKSLGFPAEAEIIDKFVEAIKSMKE